MYAVDTCRGEVCSGTFAFLVASDARSDDFADFGKRRFFVPRCPGRLLYISEWDAALVWIRLLSACLACFSARACLFRDEDVSFMNEHCSRSGAFRGLDLHGDWVSGSADSAKGRFKWRFVAVELELICFRGFECLETALFAVERTGAREGVVAVSRW